MRTMPNSRVTLAGMAVVAVVSVAACTAHPAGNATGPGNGQTATSAASAPGNSGPAVAASPSATAPSAPPNGQGGVENLVISSTVKSELTAAFAASWELSPAGLAGAGPLPGSVYYAYDPAAGTYWALASFHAASSIPMNIQTEVNNSNIGMFQRTGTGPWLVVAAGYRAICSYMAYFPPAVLTAWSISTVPGC